MKSDIQSVIKSSLVAATLCAGALPATSSAVVTAFLDTGLSADELDGHRMNGVRVAGYDFVNEDSDPDDDSSISHGTDQALIFNDHAPAEQFMPLKTYEGSSASMSLGIGQRALDFATADERVKVIAINRLQPIDVGRLRTAVNRDTVIVVNAGNQGLGTPQDTATLVPQLDGGGLIVAGHTSDGIIASKSNRPGAAYANHTITALYTSPRTDTRGTSFSMARVAAAAARVKTQAPHLTPQEVVEILKNTATDAGEPGVDAVYGHGLLNMNAALSPVGTGSVATGGSSGGSSSSSSGLAAAGALGIGAGLYALLKKDKKLKKTLILDDYGRGYHVDLTEAAYARDAGPSMNLAMAGLEREQHTVMTSSSADVTRFTVISTPRLDLYASRPFEDENERRQREENISLSFHEVHTSGRQSSFSLNESQRGRFGAAALIRDEKQSVSFLNNDTLTAPFMGFTDQGYSSAMSLKPTDRSGVTFGLSSNDEDRRWGQDSESVFVETNYQTRRWGLGFQLGQLTEKGSLFGGSANGPFGVDTARTLSLGLSGHYKLGQNTSVIGAYTRGITEVKEQNPGLLKDFSTLQTDSYGFGLVSSDIWRRGDALGVGYFQPLRVIRGEVDSDVPYARDNDGLIYKNRSRYSLNPDGREKIYELYYSANAGKSTRLGTHLLYREEALHDRDAPRERVFMLSMRQTF